ncbi:MAG: efflux RND transporter periplasmic adaptor subunit [Woeseiaceae bacterium]
MTKTISAALLSISIATVLPACGTGEASVAESGEPEAVMPLPVEVALPQTADIYEIYETTTTIGPDAEAAVLARVPGEVVEILVEEGDRVEQGQILARLDGERLRLQMLQAKASLDMTTREYERFVSLRERGLVSASALESLKFDVDALTASYELMRLNYNYTKIRAPISGVISNRTVKPGTHVGIGAPVFGIAETSKLVAYLHIPQVELARIETGDEAIVHVDAMPGHEFRATLARISPTIDARNGTFRATVYIDNEEGLLAPGMFTRFRIACEKHAGALLVPSRAVVQEDNDHVVYVVTDGAASRRRVTAGIESGGMTEILTGLDADDQIVVTGQASLRDGSKVLASNRASDNVTG